MGTASVLFISQIWQEKRGGYASTQTHTHKHIHVFVYFPLTTYKDPDGSYIMVNGSIDGVLVSLFNIYAPDEDEPKFIQCLMFWYFTAWSDFDCVTLHGQTTKL